MRVDRVCRWFEDEWNFGRRVRLEDCLSGFEESLRDALLVELIALEVELRMNAGESPVADEYSSRFPAAQWAVTLAFQDALALGPLKPPPLDAVPDEHFGGFRIICEIGRGGMGVVYEAVQESLGRRVALKTLPHRFDARDDRRRRFQREARAIGRLHHSNIVDVFGMGEHEGVSFIAMRLIDGVGLDGMIATCHRKSGQHSFLAKPIAEQHAPLKLGEEESPAAATSLSTSFDTSISSAATSATPPPSLARSQKSPKNLTDLASFRSLTHRVTLAARIGSQIADALQYAHGRGVLHRDVKPSNILLDRADTAWLADFGLAKMLHDDESVTLTEEGNILGTLKYLPPENLRGPADARGDIYSLGLSLYELVTLRPAFTGTDRSQLLNQLSQPKIERIELSVTTIPRDLATIIHKAIDIEPAARYQTAGELADDLRRFLNDEPIQARRVSWLEHFVRWSRHNKALASLLMTLVLLVSVVAVSSTVAAGYFRSLSATLIRTVLDVTDAKAKAERLTDEVEAARQASQSTIADMQTERGLLASEQSDFATAMLWFANAAEQTPHDPQRVASNRLRAKNWMNETVLPVAALRFPVSAVRRRLVFQPTVKSDVADQTGEPGGVSSRAGRDPIVRGLTPPGSPSLLLSVASGQVELWDVRTEQMLPWTKPGSGFTDAGWLADGRHVAVGLKSGEVQIRAVPSGEIVRAFQTPEPVQVIACSTDGKRIAIGGEVVQVWNVSSEPVLEHAWPHPQTVHSLLFNPSGDRLVTACRDDQVRVFAVGEQSPASAPLFEPVPHKTFVESSPVFVGDRVVVTAFNWQVDWRDASTGLLVGTNSVGSLPRILRMTTSPDGRCVGASTEASVELWPTNGERITVPQSHPVSDIAFSPDGTTVATACADWNASLWSAPWGKPSPVKVPQLKRPELCTYSPDGELLAVCSDDEIRVWKLPTLNAAMVRAPGWGQIPTRPRPSFDGRWVTRGKWHEMPWVPEIHELTVLETATGQAAGPAISLFGIIDSSLCDDRHSVAVISRKNKGGLLTFYEVATGQQSQLPIEFSATPHSVAARPGHPQVAVLCEDGTLLVIDSRDGRRLQEWTHANWKWEDRYEIDQSRVIWSPDGSALIAVTAQSDIVVRDGDTGRERFPAIHPLRKGGVCRAIDVSADSLLLATAVTGENAVQIWDMRTGKPKSAPLLHPGDAWGLFAVKFSPDGRRVLSASKDGLARLWDWQAGKLACPAMKHADEVYDVAFTSDGNYGLTFDREVAVHVWDLVTGKRVVSPIRFPRRTDGFNNGITQLAVVGFRVIVGAPDFPVIDLSQLLSDPGLSTESLRMLAELSSARRIALGESNVLTSDEWESRWIKLKDRPARQTVSRTDSPLREMNGDDARRTAERLVSRLPDSTAEQVLQKERHRQILDSREIRDFLILAGVQSTIGEHARSLELIQEAWPSESSPEFGYRLYVMARCYHQFHQPEAARKQADNLIKWLGEHKLPQSLDWLTPELVRREYSYSER